MKAMEQRAPRIAAFATTVTSMSIIALLGNAFLGKYPGQEGQRVLFKPLFEGFVSGERNDYWASTGWSTQEWIWLVLSISLGLLAVWCRQDRPVPELPKQRSVAEQIADFESSTTNVGTTSVSSVTTKTSSIISSIVGETKSVDAREVESATALLSSGALGSYAASIVSERNSDIESRTFESELQSSELDEVIVENREFLSEGPAYIPLPGKEEQKETQSLFREPKTEFVSDGPAHIPLPELPELDEPVPLSLPEMPDLDDLLESDETVPSLPNLDDLF
ncbi:MAG TPA: hypothetical protein D7I16_01175 [Candidatus Poseidoniales archaeon]|nr:MAG TPA: hypothetical protein D7H78_06055 [Candidatus Poseidoniales archaeon]DAC71202.1 MAG TPA: hypothetical protein D7I16_01175 [Candidatus Poseidoniales archaeon]